MNSSLFIATVGDGFGSAGWINLAYIIASILFILGIKMLGRAETARRGNLISSLGMLTAVIAVLFDQKVISSGLDGYLWLAGALALGAIIGLILAIRVKMTGMPEMVAMLNGFGGLASLLVVWSEYTQNPLYSVYGNASIFITIIIGAVTVSGSMLAFGKLSEMISGRPFLFAGQHIINAILALLLLVCLVVFVSPMTEWHATAFYVGMILSLIIGVTVVMPIGGGDMPVIISMLNSFSGLAAAATGFVLMNNVLVVSGCLVGASGMILTIIMCKAMNRNLKNLLFGGFGAARPKAKKAGTAEPKAVSVEDAYLVLEAARNVVVIPGYGMAVAQAQHVVKELGERLEANGAEVRYAIHPVAGRMPGHMNVLLAEADVPYEQLCEMDSINPSMPMVDVAIVIGANDVVNPASNDPGSPIYGMPIIKAYEARTVFVLKRGRGAGFSGIENELFVMPNTRMIYGDAKATITQLVAEFGK